MEVEGGNVLRKNLKQIFVTIAGYNVRGQFFVYCKSNFRVQEDFHKFVLTPSNS